jgi:hypothetical protein
MNTLQRVWRALPALVRRLLGGLGMLASGIAAMAFAVFLVYGIFDGQFNGVIKPAFGALCALVTGAFLALCGVAYLFVGDESNS